jgi:hypothetical protein
MVDKLEDLDNLILNLNNILSKDKRFENELNHDYYLKKLSKEIESKNIEMPLTPLNIIPDYTVNLSGRNIKNIKKESQYEDAFRKLEKDLEELINKLSSTPTLDISRILSELEKLKKISHQNFEELKRL